MFSFSHFFLIYWSQLPNALFFIRFSAFCVNTSEKRMFENTEKSISTCFWLLQAPKSWSKYTAPYKGSFSLSLKKFIEKGWSKVQPQQINDTLMAFIGVFICLQ